METIQKFAVPLAIIIAGALIAGALYFASIGRAPKGGGQGTARAEKNIRPVQKDDHILGNADAKITIVEFSDTECPFCKRFHATMHEVIDTYGKDGKVAWVYRHFPIAQLHPKAQKRRKRLNARRSLEAPRARSGQATMCFGNTPINCSKRQTPTTR